MFMKRLMNYYANVTFLNFSRASVVLLLGMRVDTTIGLECELVGQSCAPSSSRDKLCVRS